MFGLALADQVALREQEVMERIPHSGPLSKAGDSAGLVAY
jgi:hypothetical protein